MARIERKWLFRGSAAVLLLAVLLGLPVLLRHLSTEAYPGLPADQREYWSWVSLTNREPQAALEQGLSLLGQHPHLRLLYLKLAGVCTRADAVEACRTAFTQAAPPAGTVALYRDAGLALLDETADTAAALNRWEEVIRSSALDPSLARLALEKARSLGGNSHAATFESIWEARLAADSTAAGAAFGLGYAAVLRGEWGRSERLLKQSARHAPQDAQPYRELGRIYFSTGRPVDFDRALTAGIEAALSQHDLEQELILRGNLGWVMAQRNDDMDRASMLIEEALSRSRELADATTEGFNLYRLAAIRLKQYRYDEVLALLDSAEARYAEYLPRQLPEVIALRGAAYSDMFRFSDAEKTLADAVEKARLEQNVAVEINASVSLGVLRARMGRYGAARETGLEALELAHEYGVVDSEIAARMLLGDVERKWGNFEAARSQLNQGLALARESRSYKREAEIYDLLGRTALDLGSPDEANAYYEQMQAAVARSSGESGMADFYLGVGQVYHLFGNHLEAVAYFDEAVTLLERAPEGSPKLFDVQVKRAWALLGLGRTAEAAAALKAAQARLPERDLSARYRVEVLTMRLLLDQEQYEAAIQAGRRALDTERALRHPVLQWYVHHKLAVAHWRLGEARQAETSFREAIQTAEAMRDHLDSRENRAVFVQDKVTLYKDFAAFLQSRGRSAEALSYTERARSRSLVDLLYTTQIGRAAGSQDAESQIIEAERRRRALANELRESEAGEGTGRVARAGATRASRLREEYVRADSIYGAAAAALPERRMASGLITAEPLSAGAVQAILRPDEAMIFFNLGASADDRPARALTFSDVYVVTPDTIRVVRLAVEAGRLAETVHFFRDRISASPKGKAEGWEPAGRRLYSQLMQPALAALPRGVRHLHIVPEGVLHYVPFAALQDESGRFLVERYTLSVAPSASVLKLCRDRNPKLWRSILTVADPTGRLPGARSEAAAIAALPAVRPFKLVGESATQENVEEFIAEYDIIHFATHGRFNARTPWTSHLELNGDVLSVEEIGRLRLNAYLVTLSACETGLSGGLTSDVPPGDEWIGLNQAFLAAGSPTVMASLWPIDDRVSSTLMSGFYRRLLEAGGKSAALAQVQRDFIKSDRTKHPFYWAAFTVIGDPL